jgi:hypothetical protein
MKLVSIRKLKAEKRIFLEKLSVLPIVSLLLMIDLIKI